ncbi:MAG: type II toxin-antitoxin system Phd/YefM family antitoxin [Candidatus Eremiobacteraeota bacterium]|nr:type II toxin-antitoxin system Phd/YefM family antitoxin [Candidatus Eremiobacteraeota bacterium]MBV9057285.1 type II toxin-antitoxin system Phd/YefM family antitoxin [Candidatus Eremiobacteraeota bacterium]MBV9700438.1 type II toxin-antitoxin system Phd/YefM family antitoxin [Candidatus Eremiobacteraeota bacterium]
MKHASVGEAKAHFSALIKRAEAGEEIVVTRSGVPVARIVPASAAKERSFANDEGLGFVADDFDAPLPAELLKQFYA